MSFDFKSEFRDDTVLQFQVGDLRNCIYLICDAESKTAALVDCQFDLTRIQSFLKNQGYRLTHILLTHSHHDHVAGWNSFCNSNN